MSNLKDLIKIIIPFFDNYPLYGAKLLDYKDFRKGVYIIKNKGNLSFDSLNELKSLVYNMNTYRKFM